MIVLCPKAFSSADDLGHHRNFLKYYLSRKGVKAIVANEVWETFRFKIIKDNKPEVANKLIAEFRGIFGPEETNIDKNHQEVPPKKEYDTNALIEKTKDLLTRRWADIDLFITTEPEKFKTIKNIEISTLPEFLLSFTEDESSRKIVEEFLGAMQRENWP